MTSLGGRWSRTTIVLMLLAVIGLATGLAAKAPCATTYRTEDGQLALDWRDWRQYSDHCYSDIIPLYGLERLQDGDLPYKSSWVDSGDGTTRYMEYPVVTGMLQYGAMRVTKAIVSTEDPTQPHRPEVIIYFGVMAAVLALAWLVAVICTIPLTARKRDVALMALSPLVAVHVFTNFDALSVALAAAGMLAWARRRPVEAGLLFGLGAAAKLYPLFILGALLVLCLRSDQMRSWWKAFGGAVAAWTLVNLPFAVLYPDGWREFFRLNSTRPADHDSIYNAISGLTGWPGFDGPLYQGASPDKLNLVTLGLFALVCLGVAAIGLTAPHRPRVASLVFLIVAGFLLTNKVWSPQYSLWLVPLAVLAIPRWIPLLIWSSVDAYLWYPRMGYFLGMADPARGNSPETFLRVVVLRDVLVVLLCALVVWTIYVPRHDPVRQTGADDPAGGPLDGTPTERRRWRDLHPFGERIPPPIPNSKPAAPQPLP
ncbi:MAG TPA: glycosyltransferase 87 family protein [Kineosporiaceae bacterium]|nr:glycosyltransferase 87 family protein [Kineosporiaceae bacterium]